MVILESSDNGHSPSTGWEKSPINGERKQISEIELPLTVGSRVSHETAQRQLHSVVSHTEADETTSSRSRRRGVVEDYPSAESISPDEGNFLPPPRIVAGLVAGRVIEEKEFNSQATTVYALAQHLNIYFSFALSTCLCILLPTLFMLVILIGTVYLKDYSIIVEIAINPSKDPQSILPTDTMLYKGLSLACPTAAILMMASPLVAVVRSFRRQSIAGLPTELFAAFLFGSTMGFVYGLRIHMPPVYITSGVGTLLQLSSIITSFFIWRVSHPQAPSGSVSDVEIDSGASLHTRTSTVAGRNAYDDINPSMSKTLMNSIMQPLQSQSGAVAWVSAVLYLSSFTAFVAWFTFVCNLENVVAPIYACVCLLPYFISLPKFPKAVSNYRKAQKMRKLSIDKHSENELHRKSIKDNNDLSREGGADIIILCAMALNNALWFSYGIFSSTMAIWGSAVVGLFIVIGELFVLRSWVVSLLIAVGQRRRNALSVIKLRRVRPTDALFVHDWKCLQDYPISSDMLVIIDLALPLLWCDGWMRSGDELRITV